MQKIRQKNNTFQQKIHKINFIYPPLISTSQYIGKRKKNMFLKIIYFTLFYVAISIPLFPSLSTKNENI
jgi:hypothetical protein